MNGKMQSTAVVIRSYNNRHVAKAVKNYLTIGVGRVIIVVNTSADKGATRGFLGTTAQDPRVQVIEMTEGYSWSNALNRALMAIQMANVGKRQRGETEFRFVLNASVEALFTADHLAAMLDAATDDPRIGVVGTSFQGRQDGNRISLGRSYRHPRNTGMLVRIEAMGVMSAGFDNRCDDLGGMEDIDFTLRMISLSGLRTEMLDLNVPLVVGVHYDQRTKEQREQAAMDNIVANWRSLFTLGTEERDRIEAVISEMGLEE